MGGYVHLQNVPENRLAGYNNGLLFSSVVMEESVASNMPTKDLIIRTQMRLNSIVRLLSEFQITHWSVLCVQHYISILVSHFATSCFFSVHLRLSIYSRTLSWSLSVSSYSFCFPIFPSSLYLLFPLLPFIFSTPLSPLYFFYTPSMFFLFCDSIFLPPPAFSLFGCYLICFICFNVQDDEISGLSVSIFIQRYIYIAYLFLEVQFLSSHFYFICFKSQSYFYLCIFVIIILLILMDRYLLSPIFGNGCQNFVQNSKMISYLTTNQILVK